MTNWLPLDTQSLTTPRDRLIRGVHVQVFPSPDDIPEALRGSYNKDAERFAIEFRYIGDRSEPLVMEEESKSAGFKFSVGKYSKRLYRIEIDAKILPADHVELRIMIPNAVTAAVEAVQRFGTRLGSNTDQHKYDPVNAALEDRRQELVDSLTAS